MRGRLFRVPLLFAIRESDSAIFSVSDTLLAAPSRNLGISLECRLLIRPLSMRNFSCCPPSGRLILLLLLYPFTVLKRDIFPSIIPASASFPAPMLPPANNSPPDAPVPFPNGIFKPLLAALLSLTSSFSSSDMAYVLRAGGPGSSSESSSNASYPKPGLLLVTVDWATCNPGPVTVSM